MGKLTQNEESVTKSRCSVGIKPKQKEKIQLLVGPMQNYKSINEFVIRAVEEKLNRGA